MSNEFPSEPTDPDLGPGGFPRHPGTPESGPAPAAVEQPASIRNAVRLMWVGAVLSLVSLVTLFASLDTVKDDVREQMLDSDSDATQAMIDTATSVTIGVIVLFSLVGVGLWLWMAWKNGQGRTWARIVATVLGGLNVVSFLVTSTSAGSNGLSMLLSLVNLALAAAILFFLWRKESSDFYEARSAPTMG